MFTNVPAAAVLLVQKQHIRDILTCLNKIFDVAAHQICKITYVRTSETAFTGKVICTHLPIVTEVNLKEQSFEKGTETIRSFFYLFKHNKIVLMLKCSES